MNEKEAQELVEKIMHCDEVIHLQQLSVPWKKPTDNIFHFLQDPNSTPEDQEGSAQGGGSVGGGQGSQFMDQSNPANQSRSDLNEGQSVASGDMEGNH